MKTTRRIAAVMLLMLCGFAPFSRAQSPPGPGSGGYLQSWSFSNTNWMSDAVYSPMAFTNLTLAINQGDGNTLQITGTNSFLQYNVVESDGTTNFAVNVGSFTVWINPAWASTNLTNGTGPGVYARIIEIGSYTTNLSTEWWSLYFSPDGCNLSLSAEGGGLLTNYFTAPVSFASNTWANIAVTYSATNTALYVNGLFVTNGPGMTVFPGSTTLSNGFFVGSDSGTNSQFIGLVDDLLVYNVELDSNTVTGTYNVFSIAYSGAPMIISNLTNAPSSPSDAATFNAVTGPGFLQNIGSSTNCVTGSQVYLTNVVCTLTTNSGTTITFTITGGTNNAVYDLFGTTALAGTNSQWFWLGQGTNCGVYTLPNQAIKASFFVLGTAQNSDADGLTDAYEMLVSHTNPFNADTDGDGLMDGWEVVYGTNPLVATPFTVWVANPSGMTGFP
jgi:hypothetical protein